MLEKYSIVGWMYHFLAKPRVTNDKSIYIFTLERDVAVLIVLLIHWYSVSL